MNISNKNGFSLFETLFVIGLFAFLGAIGLPFTIDAYRHYLLSSETQAAVSILRRAEGMATANKDGQSFGISIQSTDYVLFRGESYESRTTSFDELYPRKLSVTVTPVADIIFEPVSGRPDSATTFTFSTTSASHAVDINTEGVINW